MKWIIYTDGAYSPLRDQGGVGIVITDSENNQILQYSKGYKQVTNNKMELLAVIIALIFIKNSLESLEIRTDSQYVIGCATKGWKRKKNVKLWNKFDQIFEEKQKLVNTPIQFSWVKGHSDNVFNNICDELAVNASKELL